MSRFRQAAAAKFFGKSTEETAEKPRNLTNNNQEQSISRAIPAGRIALLAPVPSGVLYGSRREVKRWAKNLVTEIWSDIPGFGIGRLAIRPLIAVDQAHNAPSFEAIAGELAHNASKSKITSHRMSAEIKDEVPTNAQSIAEVADQTSVEANANSVVMLLGERQHIRIIRENTEDIFHGDKLIVRGHVAPPPEIFDSVIQIQRDNSGTHLYAHQLVAMH